MSGNFSAEIRLGYYVKDGKKAPFKGGLFTGNYFEAAKEIELSSERVEKAGLISSKCVKLHKGEIVGMS